jgi:hypothetical protein
MRNITGLVIIRNNFKKLASSGKNKFSPIFTLLFFIPDLA